MYQVRATHTTCTYTQLLIADCYIPKYVLLNLVQSHLGLQGDTGQPNMVFQSITASRIQNDIVCDLFWTRCEFVTQTVPFIIKSVDVRFDCSFSPNPESLTAS